MIPIWNSNPDPSNGKPSLEIPPHLREECLAVLQAFHFDLDEPGIAEQFETALESATQQLADDRVDMTDATAVALCGKREFVQYFGVVRDAIIRRAITTSSQRHKDAVTRVIEDAAEPPSAPDSWDWLDPVSWNLAGLALGDPGHTDLRDLALSRAAYVLYAQQKGFEKAGIHPMELARAAKRSREKLLRSLRGAARRSHGATGAPPTRDPRTT